MGAEFGFGRWEMMMVTFAYVPRVGRSEVGGAKVHRLREQRITGGRRKGERKTGEEEERSSHHGLE